MTQLPSFAFVSTGTFLLFSRFSVHHRGDVFATYMACVAFQALMCVQFMLSFLCLP